MGSTSPSPSKQTGSTGSTGTGSNTNSADKTQEKPSASKAATQASREERTKPRVAPAAVIPDATTAPTRRSALYGHFVDVIKGDEKGAYGVYEDNAELGSDGFPETIIVRTRDDDHRLIVVKYEDTVFAEAGRR